MKQKDDLAGEGGTVGTAAGAHRAPDGGDPSAKPLTLPPGTTLEKFQDFMRRARDIVGDDNATVISSENELMHESYLDPSKAYDVGVVPLTVKDSKILIKSADVLCCSKGVFRLLCSHCSAGST
jgi:hypothetical protein